MQFVHRSSLYFLPAGLQMHVIKLSALAQKRRWALLILMPAAPIIPITSHLAKLI